VYSLTEYFGIPFNVPQPIFTASVATMGGNLNVRYAPTITSDIVGKIPNGSEVVVYAQVPDWTLVGYNGVVGYVSSQFLQY
jgi:N-acetylmuramoyl-L-alanine amidase